MSSTSAFQVLPGNGTYAAAKAYVLFHSEALTEETKDTGVTVTACCPGPVHTEFQEVGQPLLMDGMPKFVWIDADRCAEDTLKALEKGRRTVIPGALPRASAFGGRLVPRTLLLPAARIATRVGRKPPEPPRR